MNKLVKIYIALIVLICLCMNSSYAQLTTSPYSLFGLGQLEGNSVGENLAMGGTGIAFLSDKSINVHNPASYSGLDSLVTIFQIGAFGKITNFNSSQENQALVNGNIRYVVMGFRIAPWIATSFGFTPYSSIGYHIHTPTPLVGTNATYDTEFSGDGGVNQFYIGSSFKITKNLSLGVNASYLFGSITHSESSDDFYFSLNDVTTLSNFNLNYGLNYKFKISSWKYNVGLIYGNDKRLGSDHEITITTSTGTDELRSRQYDYSLPQNIGAGLAVSKGYFKAGVDFEINKWEDVEFENTNLRTRNSERYSFGVEFPSLGMRKGSSRMIFYRFGGEYRGSYFLIKDEPINYYALTVGAGLPLKGYVSAINLALEVGQNGTATKGLFRENFVTLHLDLALRDIWFRQRKYE